MAVEPREDDRDAADKWLAAELNRIWLLSERALRAFQKAQIRPQPNHPSLVEVESMLSARRTARLGKPADPEDEDQLTRAIADVDSKLPALRKASPLGKLTDSLQLRPLEVETLVTVVAPHLDSPLSDLFTILRGPGTRRGVDLALVTTLFRLKRADRVTLLDTVDPERPLLYWRLMQVLPAESLESFGSMSHRALRPTFDLVSSLVGRTQLAPELSRCSTIRMDQPSLEDLRFDPVTRKDAQTMCDAAKNDPKRGEGAPWLVLWGPTGVGKKTLAARVAAHQGRPIVTFDPNAVDKAVFEDLFARVQREALMRQAMLYIGPIPSDLQQNGGRELFRRLSRFTAPLALGFDTMQPPRLVSDHPLWELKIPLPSEPTRAKLWEEQLPSQIRAGDLKVESIARAFKLTAGEILAVANEAKVIAEREMQKVTHADARECIARRLRNDLGELAQPVTVTTKWSDLVLPQEDMDRVQEFIARRRYADKVYNEWGYGQRIGYGKGLIALFSGPPGTGKTMLAGLIAEALDLDMYQVDLAQVVSKWVGETEKQLAKVFDQAERAHAVLLFDEADSLFAKRTEVKSSNDRYGNMATNYLLQRLEQYTGVAVLTTNKDASLDEALQRRLTLHLYLEIPEVDERERLWKSFMPDKAPVSRDVDLRTLALEFELSGGYIKNAAVRAAFLAASHDAPISMELLRLASALEMEDMGRVVFHRHKRQSLDPNDLRS
jgi:SpoVK/Ycf46/Vps4 family AAA+-type ATPase